MQPIVSVVLPTCRRTDLLAKCLDALIQQDFEPEGYEILICDDAAEEATRRLVNSASAGAPCSIFYLPVNGKHGPAAARNLGWRAGQGRVIAFTDDDCLPQRGWLRAGLNAIDAGPDAAWGRLVMPLPPIPTDYEQDAAGLSRAVFVTANCFCRRTALERVGGFDERFTAAWREDTDLYFSLVEHRCRLVHAADAVVVHPIRPATWGVSLRQQSKTIFDVLLIRKHPRLCARGIPAIPRSYYATVSALALMATAAALGQATIAYLGATVWFVLTLLFCLRRLRRTSKSPAHVAEMTITSALIPPLSLYWRLHGLLAFRHVQASKGDQTSASSNERRANIAAPIGALEHEVA
jgi:GT2 family glycosyltransferase